MSFTKKLEEQGVKSSMLDELVHEAAASIASGINNGGLSQQVDFLKQEGYSEANILAAVSTTD